MTGPTNAAAAAKGTQQTMRLFAVPLLRDNQSFFCQYVPRRQTYLSRATVYATSKWEGLALADRKSMKGRLYVMGQQLLDRMDYQEYFLKGVPLREEREEGEGKVEVPMLYPSVVLQPQEISASLNRLITDRLPYHRKYMIYSALFVPLSSTFSIVPIIPNFPLFYNLFRLYSHYKAYKGAQHLRHIFDQRRIMPQPSDEMNTAFSSISLSDRNVIDEAQIEQLGHMLSVPGLESELKRARHQLLERLKKEKMAKAGAKGVQGGAQNEQTDKTGVDETK